MKNGYLELFVQVMALGAIILPHLIQRYSKKQKLVRSLYFMDLLSTKNKLEECIDREQDTVLRNHLLLLKSNIEKDLQLETISRRYNFFPFLMAIEIYIGYNTLFLRLMRYVATHAVEGIMEKTSMQLFLWGTIFSTTALLSLGIGKKIQSKIPNYWLYNILIFIIFNILLFMAIIVLAFLLKKLDPSVPWF